MKSTFKTNPEIAAERIESTFDSYTTQIVNNCIHSAYELVNEYKKQAPEWFQVDSRHKRLVTDWKNSAVEFLLIQACDKRLLPFYYDIKENSTNSNDYILLKTIDRKSIITINQTQGALKKSRHAQFRQDLSNQFESQLLLFDDVEKKSGKDVQYYFELNHGYQSEKPNFIVAGLPKPSKGWYGQKNILSNLVSLSKGEEKDIKTVGADISDYSKDDFIEFVNSKGE